MHRNCQWALSDSTQRNFGAPWNNPRGSWWLFLEQGSPRAALTIRGRAQPAEDVHQRRLPGAAVAQQRRDLPLVDVKGQICSQGTARGAVRVGSWLPQDPSQRSQVELHSHPAPGDTPWPGWDGPTPTGAATFQRRPGKGGDSIREVGQGGLHHCMGRGGIGGDASRLSLGMKGSFLGCWFGHQTHTSTSGIGAAGPHPSKKNHQTQPELKHRRSLSNPAAAPLHPTSS